MLFAKPYETTKEKGQNFSKEQDTYETVADKNGHMIIRKDGGKENIYSKIQEYSDMANINKIIERVENGEPLPQNNAKEGTYGDFRELQGKTIHDLKNDQTATEKKTLELIEAMPDEIKEQYHDNKSMILENISNGNIIKDLDKLREALTKKETTANSENKEK